METIYQYARYLHILAGMTAFFVAPIALFVQKGGKNHVRWGRVFFWAMVVVAISAVPMTIYRPNLFLFFVAIFSFHLSWSGYRAIRRRKAKPFRPDQSVDIMVAGVALLAYVGLVGLGIFQIAGSDQPGFGIIALVFGAIGLRFSLQEIRSFRKPPSDKMDWWFKHMQGMMGSYIATLSAFSAVNFLFLPTVVRWLWPTLILGTLQYFWEAHYRKKFSKTAAARKIA